LKASYFGTPAKKKQFTHASSFKFTRCQFAFLNSLSVQQQYMTSHVMFKLSVNNVCIVKISLLLLVWSVC